MYSAYDIFLYFMLYSIIGWCVEVIYATVNKGIFINRGFLNGPLCPIYGIGVTIVIICLTPLNENLLLLFVGSFFLTTLLEFLTGLILELIFNQKWWNYTDQPFNIKGYVCLKFSLIWGLACVFVMRIVHPLISSITNYIPHKVNNIIIISFYVLLIVDIMITVFALSKIHLQIRIVNDIDKMLKSISDSVGFKLSEQTIESMEHINEGKEYVDEAYEKLVTRVKEKFGKDYNENRKLGYVAKRLEKAFPSLDFTRFKKIKEHLDEIKNNKKNHK